ncbi:hypothetical protein ASPVEDRAFT_26527 [Aspergillus versicolor CBS 583.65]|uniref:C2H2-type domain-containing protein n=2 Tax=Aspergillus subgen. Nidulantes TaxID=2720870 RepID=A0A1L9PDZ4_ASPVE|nr:uncharacterized protein ASPVEDRAFT_26527 [Aspergillus versicolor CBS 583.65]OJI99747.1 hypothetical protein ASPVEDRAFT_26527 [Aspergillus versicolor CBS 583.65]
MFPTSQSFPFNSPLLPLSNSSLAFTVRNFQAAERTRPLARRDSSTLHQPGLQPGSPRASIRTMAEFEPPLYNLPSSPFAETLWAGWNVNSSPVSSQDESNFEIEPNWQQHIYPIPDYYCLPLDTWPSQPTTPLSSYSPTDSSFSTGQLPDNPLNVANWMPATDTFAAPVFSAAPTAASCTPELTPQCISLPDYSSASSGTTTPITQSSPAEPDSLLPLSATPNTKTNRVTKTTIRCWEHSCGGRAFSSLGNYERHLREKSGRAKSFTCEQCGQRFTRSTAKNKHIRYGRCRMQQVEPTPVSKSRAGPKSGSSRRR